jgi:hypothetical protein
MVDESISEANGGLRASCDVKEQKDFAFWRRIKWCRLGT